MEICGISKNTNKRKQIPWWNQQVNKVRKNKKSWKNYLSTEKDVQLYEIYKAQREKSNL